METEALDAPQITGPPPLARQARHRRDEAKGRGRHDVVRTEPNGTAGRVSGGVVPDAIKPATAISTGPPRWADAPVENSTNHPNT
jgi:hypothetical protein